MISQTVCSAAPFRRIGKQTQVLARLSTVAGERGSSDSLRDNRGFALKMKTEEGNWDFVGTDLPVFFICDPAKFPSLNRSHKRHPQTAVADASLFWDFHNNNQEGAHCLMQLFGPLDAYSPYQRDGSMRLDGKYGSDPDYGM